MEEQLPADDAVRRRQEAFYVSAEEQRFAWLTTNPLIQNAERSLLGELGGMSGCPSILEVGCGEGANFATLHASGAPFRYTGFDCFPEKVRFCRDHHRGGQFLIADARVAFPFCDGSFDRVLVRDILHHLSEPDRVTVLRESVRVLAPGGHLWIVEGNASNLIGRGFAMIFPHERCMLETRVPRLQRFVAATLSGYQITEKMAEPSNLFRLVAHYQFGFPGLGRTAFMGWATRAWQSVSRLRPSRRWAYSLIDVRKPERQEPGFPMDVPA